MAFVVAEERSTPDGARSGWCCRSRGKTASGVRGTLTPALVAPSPRPNRALRPGSLQVYFSAFCAAYNMILPYFT